MTASLPGDEGLAVQGYLAHKKELPLGPPRKMRLMRLLPMRMLYGKDGECEGSDVFCNCYEEPGYAGLAEGAESKRVYHISDAVGDAHSEMGEIPMAPSGWMSDVVGIY
eukprot:CAMPEP_0180216332 /NCGR_PEP_ID=MMETSP0987-20121128/16116_1 /TAXON_ID=697907 /ORGANISM="non described non described, Strain CCMP2293" /LENGTH=108 /DNA_ID=CAMNT_0022175337 /DNA_START=80 /DNA_END=407 /DNA_ORIENTATION=+